MLLRLQDQHILFSQQRCLILYKVRLRLLFSPPSFDVRNVKRIGVSPKASLKSFNTSSTLSNSKTPSNQSTRHSTTSTGMLSNVFASAMISSFVTPTIGTQILELRFRFQYFLLLLYSLTIFLLLSEHSPEA